MDQEGKPTSEIERDIKERGTESAQAAERDGSN